MAPKLASERMANTTVRKDITACISFPFKQRSGLRSGEFSSTDIEIGIVSFIGRAKLPELLLLFA
jgi:hypothetical protein